MIQQQRTQGNGTAAAAGTACVYILLLQVKNQCAAICKLTPKADAIFSGQCKQRFFSHLSQVSGDDQIEICIGGVEIIEMGLDGGKGSRG